MDTPQEEPHLRFRDCVREELEGLTPPLAQFVILLESLHPEIVYQSAKAGYQSRASKAGYMVQRTIAAEEVGGVFLPIVSIAPLAFVCQWDRQSDHHIVHLSDHGSDAHICDCWDAQRSRVCYHILACVMYVATAPVAIPSTPAPPAPPAPSLLFPSSFYAL